MKTKAVTDADVTIEDPGLHVSDAASGSGSQSSVKETTSRLFETTSSLDASKAAYSAEDISSRDDMQQRLALFYELPLQFGEETRLEALLQLIVERVVNVIPGARRGAVLVKDKNGKLALKAHLPAARPSVSLTMAARAMDQRLAFVWPPISVGKQQIPDSVVANRIKSA